MTKKKCLIITLLVSFLIGILAPNPIQASTTVKISSTATGQEFFNKIAKSKGAKKVVIQLQGTTDKELEDDLYKFAWKVKMASNILYDYDIYSVQIWYFHNKNQVTLEYNTEEIRDMETGKTLIDIDTVSGKELLDKIHSSKRNYRYILAVSATSKKQAKSKLKKFANEVKKASKYDLTYAIYTKENIKKFKDYSNGVEIVTYLPMQEKVKDIKAAENMVSKIPNWNKLSAKDKFLKLSAACNKISEWKKPGGDFHFYNKKNKLVCWDYAFMYKRVAELVTNDCESELVLNKKAEHALVLVRVGKDYYEGNNWFLSKNYKDKRLSFRHWYKSNPKEYGKTKIEKAFIKANGV